MPLISSAIVAFCLSSQGQYNRACNSALEAATRQTGIYATEEQIESAASGAARRKAEYLIGNKAMGVVGTVAYAARVARDRKLSFNLPNLGICDSIDNSIGPDSYDMHIQWKF